MLCCKFQGDVITDHYYYCRSYELSLCVTQLPHNTDLLWIMPIKIFTSVLDRETFVLLDNIKDL